MALSLTSLLTAAAWQPYTAQGRGLNRGIPRLRGRGLSVHPRVWLRRSGAVDKNHALLLRSYPPSPAGKHSQPRWG